MATRDQPISPVGPSSSSDDASINSKRREDDKHPVETVSASSPALASHAPQRMEAAMGDAILRFLRIRKTGQENIFDPDSIATQPSIWDSENIDEYKELYIHDKWENYTAFDPSFRWTWKEENRARHKVDVKIMVSSYGRERGTGSPDPRDRQRPADSRHTSPRSGYSSCLPPSTWSGTISRMPSRTICSATSVSPSQTT